MSGCVCHFACFPAVHLWPPAVCHRPGLLSAMAASFPCAATFWVVYDTTKTFVGSRLAHHPSASSSSASRDANAQGDLGAWQRALTHVTAAAVADLFVISLRNPFEVVKQQLQVGSHGSTVAAVKTIARVDGLRGFFAGWTPTLARDVPFDAVQFMLYEYMKRSLAVARGEGGRAKAWRW